MWKSGSWRFACGSALALSVVIVAVACCAASEPAAPTGYPAFRWDRAPVYAHLGKRSGPFTDEEARFLATRFALVTIEKTQELQGADKAEEAIYRAARAIKAINPGTRVLFYWNAYRAYPMYAAHETFAAHPDWALRDKHGRPVAVGRGFRTHDLSNPAVRDWWTGVCTAAVQAAPLDGVFADAIPQIAMVERANRQAWGDEKWVAVEAGLRAMLDQARRELGPDRLLIFNGLRGDLSLWADGGSRYLEHASGAMLEHFGHYGARDGEGRIIPERMATDIELIGEAGRRGKIVLVKGWPGFSEEEERLDDEEKARLARERITFPLAAFLAAAEAHAYFGYSWNWWATGGWFQWYPEYDKPLGPPKGPAKRNGWVYEREFEHASVWLDVEHEKARITWRERTWSHEPTQ